MSVYKFTSIITGNTIDIEILPDDILIGNELRRILRDENGILSWATPNQVGQDYIRITPTGDVYGKSGKLLKTLQSSGRYQILGFDTNKKSKSISLLKGMAASFLPNFVKQCGWPQCIMAMPIDITMLYPTDNIVTNGGGNSHKYGKLTMINGKHVPGYKTFQHMHHRCTPEWVSGHPSYKGVYVDEQFYDWQDFKIWYDANIYNLKSDSTIEIDKDMLGKRYYSPDTCLLVPNYINTFFSGYHGLNTGVTVSGNRFQAQCGVFKGKGNNKVAYLGSYKTIEEAHQAWADCKNSQLINTVIPYYIGDIPDEYKNHTMVNKVIDTMKAFKFV